jgi:hypothetical protein
MVIALPLRPRMIDRAPACARRARPSQDIHTDAGRDRRTPNARPALSFGEARPNAPDEGAIRDGLRDVARRLGGGLRGPRRVPARGQSLHTGADQPVTDQRALESLIGSLRQQSRRQPRRCSYAELDSGAYARFIVRLPTTSCAQKAPAAKAGQRSALTVSVSTAPRGIWPRTNQSCDATSRSCAGPDVTTLHELRIRGAVASLTRWTFVPGTHWAMTPCAHREGDCAPGTTSGSCTMRALPPR